MEKINREKIYTESRTLRDEAVSSNNADFLDKIKAVRYLTEEMVLSVYQAADYYEVSVKTIYTIIERNRSEFEQDGLVTLSGENLKDFKTTANCSSNEEQFFGKRTRYLMLLTKRSLLRLGLIMTNCAMATKIRNYLLNLEETATVDQKSWAVQREVGIIERKRMATALSKYLPDSENKRFAYPNFTNMLYKILFGKDAKTLRTERNVSTNDALRDSFSKEELAVVEEGENIITALIALGFTYDQIKEHLNRKYQKAG